jgi:hypothetical protein
MVSTWPTASPITYGQTLAASSLSGGTATPALGTFAFTTPSLAPSAGTGLQSVTYSPTDTTNYHAATSSVSVTVSPKTLTVTGITASNKGYDGNTTATLHTAGATLLGALNGDSVGLSTATASGAFTDPNVGTAKTVLITGLSLTGTSATNYSLTQPTTTANITAAGLTVAGIQAQNKIYDGTTNATLIVSNALLVGIIPGDTVTLNTTNATGAFVDKKVGTAKPVAISGLTLLGSDAAKYTLTPPTTNANITAASLTVSGITAGNKVYDGATTATLTTANAILIGVFGNDIVSLNNTGALGAFADPNAGAAKTVLVSGLTISGSDSTNYALTQPTASANITPADPLVTTWPTASPITYGQTLAVSSLSSGTASPAGTFAFTTPTLAPAAGAASQSVTYSPTDTTNYHTATSSVSVTVNPKTLAVTGVTASNKVYDGTTSATLNASGATLVGALNGDSVGLNTAAASGAFTDPDVGTAKTVLVSGLSLTGTSATNYSLTQPTTTANITAASVTVAGIQAQNKIYDGTTNATLIVSNALLIGIIPGDTVTLNTTNASGSFADKTVGKTKSVAINGLTLIGPDADKYTLKRSTTHADITAASLTVAGISASDKVYDGATTATLTTANATLVGLFGNDIVSLNSTGGLGAFADPNAGAAKTVLVSGLAITGTDATNYALTQPTTTANITPADPEVSTWPTASPITYGQTLAASSLSGGAATNSSGIMPLFTGASGTFTFTTPTLAPSAGTALQSVTYSPPDTTNYHTATSSVSVTVSPKTLTVTGITASNKVYDGTTSATLNASGATLAGALNGDSVGLNTAAASGAFTDPDVGTAKTVLVTGLNLTGTSATNYSLTQPTATANITAASLTVAGIQAQNKIYDGTTNASLIVSNALLIGIIPGDTVTVDTTNATGSFVDKTVGKAKSVAINGLTLIGADADKYTLKHSTAHADITAANLTVAGISASDKVYDGDTTTTLGTSNATLVGVFSSDIVSLDTTGSFGAFTDPNAAAAKTVLISGLIITGTDATNYSLTQPTTTANITPADPLVTTWPTASPITYGETLADSSLTGGAPASGILRFVTSASGTFSFTTPTLAPSAGTALQSVTYSPADTTNYHTATGSVSVTVNAAGSITALVSSGNTSWAGSNINFTVTVQPMAPASTTPTGSVQFYCNGIGLSSSMALSNGVASFQTSGLPLGTNVIMVVYHSDGNFLDSSNTLNQVVQPVAGTARAISIQNKDSASVLVTFAGTPGAQYLVQASDTLAATSWENVSTNTAGPDGQWTFIDSKDGHSARFYRSVIP